ncbi:NADPH2:quinone reductase [Aliiruegeria haliotis]|uniref:NADPH2:quinone reductase n=1 Tax=Aliiruegeria haliotis TaxID=1280846 RepID=A0A2T0RSX1_9RHOB|nr:NADPH:quinone reductase [Aliiruegeria haliotis]PRY24261.1 NADPH2:quinone reductase [Aliiruegeria haliotis]
MKAVWYEEFGDADAVLTVGKMPDPAPGPGEVLVRVHASAINPSDVKLRAGARPGAAMEFPRIIPHSDGAGVIVAAGEGVDRNRLGQRVWIWNGQWQRPFGTAAELIALPQAQAVPLPDAATFAAGACMGIPAITAWTAVLGDGPVDGQTILVTGGAGTVGRYAVQMARLAGARVITTVSSKTKAEHSTAEEWINYRDANVVDAVMEMTGGAGVDRVVEVDFGANQDDSLAVLKSRGTIAAYASARVMTPVLQFYPMMFKNLTLRAFVVYLLDDAMRARGNAQLAAWLESGDLSHAVVDAGTLSDVPAGHDLVAAGQKLGTVVVSV